MYFRFLCLRTVELSNYPLNLQNWLLEQVFQYLNVIFLSPVIIVQNNRPSFTDLVVPSYLSIQEKMHAAHEWLMTSSLQINTQKNPHDQFKW